MRSLLACALIVALGGCAPDEIDDRGSSTLDFDDPKQIVDSIFHAARTGEAGHLARLCDDDASAAARRVCSVTPASADWSSFVRHFADGRVIGEPRVSGDRALVNIVYGQGGAVAETMELSRRGGRWRLLAF